MWSIQADISPKSYLVIIITLSLTGRPAGDALSVGSQRVLYSALVGHIFESLVKNQATQYHQARLLAAAAAHSGDWLHVVPISSCGLRLNNEAIRVAVGLRLGSDICQPYQCDCGESVDTRGSHALSCKRNPGRSQRHHFLKDLHMARFVKGWFTIGQRTTRPIKVKQQTPRRSHPDSVARGSVRHL